MNEETQASRLAEWLEAPAGTEPPEDIDPDVLAAVYALRPDRVPAPRVSLDDILGAISEGPFAAPTTAGANRFRVIEGGDESVARVDEPELATANGGGFSDVDEDGNADGGGDADSDALPSPLVALPPLADLGEADETEDFDPRAEYAAFLRESEDAARAEEPASGLPTAQESASDGAAGPERLAPVIALQRGVLQPRAGGGGTPALHEVDAVPDSLRRSADPAARRRRSSAWLYPVLGTMLAAAAAMAIAVPILSQQVLGLIEHIGEAPRPASAPPPPPAPSVGGGATPMIAEAEPPPAAEPAAPALPAEAPVAAEDAKKDAGPGRDAGAERLAAQAEKAEAMAAPPPPPSAPVVVPADSSVAELEGAGLGDAPAPAAAPAVVSRAKVVREEADAPARAAEADDEELVANESKRSASSAPDRYPTGKTSAAKTPAPSAGSAAAPQAAATAPATTTPTTTATTGSTSSTRALPDRARALAFDYNPSWYTGYADVSAAWTAASTAEKAKNYPAAIAQYEPFLKDGRVDVAQDAAWRAARDWWAAGSSSTALAVVDAGLARGGGTSAFRVHLLVLKGDLLNALGRPSDAGAAWAEAAELNRRRGSVYLDSEDAAFPK